MNILKQLSRACIFLLACAGTGCGGNKESAASAQPPGSAAASATAIAKDDTSTNTSESIDWFSGSVDQAFALAKQSNRPLFLYWGAVWCPPCHELKATVFQDPRFIATTQQFIAVNLDGDTAAAQALAEKFNVIGYPTLVVFSAAGEELTRIPNGLDLQAYANILSNSLDALQPITSTIERYTGAHNSTPAQLSKDCELLSNHSWEQDRISLENYDAAKVFLSLSRLCLPVNKVHGGSLLMRYIDAGLAADAGTPIASAERPALAQELQEFLGPEFIRSNLYNYLAYVPIAIKGLSEPGSTSRAQLIELASDSEQQEIRSSQGNVFKQIQLTRGLVELSQLDAAKEEFLPLPEALETAIGDLANAAQALPANDARRHATINAAGNLLREANMLQSAHKLLSEEAANSKYAYYFKLGLASIEKKLGNNAAALAHLREAHEQSKGVATRFQWGVNYLQGLLELDGNNLEALTSNFETVFGELVASGDLHQRSASRLKGLETSLLSWAEEDSATQELRTQALDYIRQFSQQQCENLQAESSARINCSAFLADVG